MGKYRRKPLVFEAHQWFKNGDHPEDGNEGFVGSDGNTYLCEGKVVRYFRRPDVPGDRVCNKCNSIMHVHGWIDTLEGGHTVCPADFIFTGVKGEHWPVKPDVVEATYEEVIA